MPSPVSPGPPHLTHSGPTAPAPAVARKLIKELVREGRLVGMCAVCRGSGGIAKDPQRGHHCPSLCSMVLVILHFGQSRPSDGLLGVVFICLHLRNGRTQLLTAVSDHSY